MPPPAEAGVAALVLAAGASVRLGRPKQLLPYRGGVLLDAALDTARESSVDQIVLALGGSAGEVVRAVDTSLCDVVLNPHFGEGCSSSIAAALPAVRPDIGVLVLLLADEPGVGADTVRHLLGGRGDSLIAVCRYDDGIGHPFAFARPVFADLAALHGDKGVWKLIERQAADVREVRVAGRIPLDVDTEEDYRHLLAELEGAR
ncbi:nucleotidyltransferase family protein [Lacisediminihabitans profunda]|uniref:Nucleotidyltransferase family protein n=1 Tax=Lacisediminihabitans profunda TaxID=2594790 RepID=A0A5C8URN3_9MICO|nr:nucleotidyltransferase family protein [Lacisediminihabitans profunda]TXN31251.1 nucleotidyltransferase family protein [Lacisediminihabitans profunda]